ncbi:MAG: EAL domain-containing protein [Pleurocapsa minor HA4230-MV1]|jgi:EAL domain-containing protein (putative c-di-GMP-specific phosphodiesterase class I)/PleD family two-component response regulator|nr:EAL domain-containing protein [Pleurocapsa minor HA4230-MV1]
MVTNKSQTNILIVEDELLIAKNTAKKLTNFGYNVIKIVSNGQAAIDCVNLEQPDLVLMDIAIKGEIDGIETASQIKSISDVPIIFTTAYANNETLDRAAETGCYGYLIKPYKEEELKATVKMTLSKHLEQSTIQRTLQSSISEYSSEYDNIYQDQLTGLPNKLFLRDLFEYLLSLIADRNPEQSSSLLKSHQQDIAQESQLNIIGVFNLNLDRFEKISSFLNKQEQDSLLKEIAQRLVDCVKNFTAHGEVVYLTPDNFVVLLAIDSRITGSKYGQSILNVLQQNYVIGDREIYLSPNIGMAFCPSDSQDITELLEQSDKAIEYGKSQGGNRCQAYTVAFNIKNSKVTGDFRLESELHHALERQELELYYQPKLDLKTNLIIGSEALLRWNHPKMGRINADKFVPIAEEIGLIKPIGEWVLTTACRQMQAWLDAGFKNHKISVNLSGAQFKQSDLFHQITQILFKTSLEPQFLELELTETILVENIRTNVQRLNMLKKLGIQICLDDFGTGYSSLGYLQQFPFDILKIDACFIRDINHNQVNAVITKNVMEMAHQLGLKVVAEGVETTAELDFLKNIQCDAIQGFLFSRPLSAQEFQKLVRKQLHLPS